jgi:hypothetical protein
MAGFTSLAFLLAPATGASPELEKLTASYHKKIDEVVEPYHDRLLSDLLNKERSLTKAGKLEEALKVREQRVVCSLAKKPDELLKNFPPEDVLINSAIQVYLRHYRAGVRPWEKKYIDELRKLERRLGASERLDDALEVKHVRVSLEEKSKAESLQLVGKPAKGNVASHKRGAKAFAPERALYLIDEDVHIERFAAGPVPAEFIVEFDKLYILREIKILFWNGDDRTYYYKVDVSRDGSKWETVADRSREGGGGLQSHTFNPRDVRSVRVRGRKNSANDRFHIIELEAY